MYLQNETMRLLSDKGEQLPKGQLTLGPKLNALYTTPFTIIVH